MANGTADIAGAIGVTAVLFLAAGALLVTEKNVVGAALAENPFHRSKECTLVEAEAARPVLRASYHEQMELCEAKYP